MEIDVI